MRTGAGLCLWADSLASALGMAHLGALRLGLSVLVLWSERSLVWPEKPACSSMKNGRIRTDPMKHVCTLACAYSCIVSLSAAQKTSRFWGTSSRCRRP